jgi:hypothetical protein
MNSQSFFEKYGIKIEVYEDTAGKVSSIGYGADPDYPNGWMFSIVSSHTPMRLEGSDKKMTIQEEMETIRSILNSGGLNDRYPLVAEEGQICIYKDKSFVYDTYKGGTVIDDFDSLDGTLDEKDEEPIMVLPSADLLGILEEYAHWLQDEKPQLNA